ncbi:MAG: tRNA glutamyl-Q(34) synthetase GluQRS [Rhizobiaceae bacterium]
MEKPVFRFAPSPNGYLHLGHALSALENERLAQQSAGNLLLRIDDIDLSRARPEFESAISEDLAWLGIEFDGAVRRQSDHISDYQYALDALKEEGLAYPAFMSRADIRDHVSAAEATGDAWPRDPDGAPHYPGVDRELDESERQLRIAAGAAYTWRLDMAAALSRISTPIDWLESGAGPNGETGQVMANPSLWGDAILARRDAPASYHLSVVVDDAIQGISDVVRGRDLFHATSIHRLLQELLGLPVPRYHHHRLLLDTDGRKLSKSRKDTSIRELKTAGLSPADVIRLIR